MKRLFFKKNLILKTFLLLFLFISLFLFSNFFYNQSKGILAVEETEEVEEAEEEEKGRLLCGKEIPVGEAMEKTGELLEEITRELEKIESNSYFLIKTQEDMEELAKNCTMENCTPKCEAITIKGATVACIHKPCQGDPCEEREKIEKLFEKITRLNKEIQEGKDKIYKLIYKSVEPLCIEGNEDIRTPGEKILCATNPACWELTRETLLSLLPEDFLEKIGLCPSITVQKAISRKLNLSRGEFEKCYVPAAELEKIGKILLNCDTVMSQNLPRETKTEEKGIPVCTSLHNWFCCY
ncbi:MAG: hypothetical protein ACKKMS_01520 [Candidatus Nealsonbacteria bacterium]